MKLVIGSVVAGFDLKEHLKVHLTQQGHEVLDLGPTDKSVFVKYNAVGERIAEALVSGKAELAVNICGTGTGAAVAGGKFKGVIAVVCETIETARAIRVVNDANCLCLGELIVAPARACRMVDAFLDARFQDAPQVPEAIRAFWAEARDEFLARGPEPQPRELEEGP